MAETKHTPGPWEAKKSGDLVWVESPVHTVCFFFRERPTEISMDAEANARLIAAAPAMYEALIEFIRAQDEYTASMGDIMFDDPLSDAADKARAALASADATDGGADV